ncbi:MAG TPA: hypothetical protein VM618_12700, partial [Acidimicrobiia bacterium]|nr:hypothetical protein [Acidimicrobiia bacterium]
MGAPPVLDADTHLYEPRDLWERYADPGDRDRALRIVDDDLGHPWLVDASGRKLHLVEIHHPGDAAAMGAYRRQVRAGEPRRVRYDEELPADFVEPEARLDRLDAFGTAESVVFPNFGLLWERPLGDDPATQLANMRAWNRWAVDVVVAGKGRLHPSAHLSLRDLDWLDEELGRLAAGGVRIGMIAPALVDGKRLSHPDLDRAWSSFVEHGVTPVFHVEAFPHPFHDAWYDGDPDPVNPVLSSVFLWTGPALALADMAVGGVFDRHPDLRLGVFEFSALWVPDFLMYLDGGFAFHANFNGAPLTELSLKPSEFIRRQVRV